MGFKLTGGNWSKGGGVRRLDRSGEDIIKGHLKKGGGVVQIIDDDYDHWEFHNFICLLDYICPQLLHSQWVLLGLDFSLFDMSESEFPFPIKSL